ncbi:MAG: hypothetical protein ACYDFT_00595 [Thermoplasmata archaeon]
MARQVAEHVEAPRSAGLNVPFHLPYYEAWRQMRWLVEETDSIVHRQVRSEACSDRGRLVEPKARLE